MLVNPVANLLQQRLSQCPQYARLLARSRQNNQNINADLNLVGLTDSAKSLLLSTLSQDIKRPIFFVVADNHIAAFYEQELTEISGGPVLFYPASEISPYEQVLSSPDNIASQMEVLLRLQVSNDADENSAERGDVGLTSLTATRAEQSVDTRVEPSGARARQRLNDHLIVIVPARALMQRVLDKQTLTTNTITLTTGQEIDRDSLAKRLIDLGYKREALVGLRGEFSIRGDIIDLYPSASNPVRLELFGDQIESIRSFGIDGQRSIAQCDSAIIPPRYWVTLHDDQARANFINNLEASTAKRAQALEPAAAETLLSIIEEEKLSFAANLYPESIEYYAPFFHSQFATLLDYIPDNAIFAFDDWDATMLSLNSYDERLQKSYAEGLESGRLLPLPGPLHLSLNDCQDKLKTQNRLFFVVGVDCIDPFINGRMQSAPTIRPIRPYQAVSETGIDMQSSSDIASKTGMDSPSSPNVISNVIQFNCQPVEHFANQMKAVVEKIRIWQSAGFMVLINSEQPQRIIDLLREWDCVSTYIGATESDGHGTARSDTHIVGASFSEPAGADAILPSGVQDPESGLSKPRPYTNLTPGQASPGREPHSNEVLVSRHGFLRGFVLEEIALAVVTDTELFGLKRKPLSYRRQTAEKTHEHFTSVADLKIGDYVVHIKHGIGQFTGVQRLTIDNEQREYLTIQYAVDDRLYVPVDQINLLSRYRGAGEAAPRLSRLGGTEWEKTKRRVKLSVKKVAEDLVNLYAMRAKQHGFASLPDTPWQYEMEEAFPFEETPDQWQAIIDTKQDLESIKPMDRLICGDVGFGKTEVAIRAIFKTVMSGKQAAVLVPTTILAQQHFNTLSERFAPFPVKIGLLSRFRTQTEQRQIIERLVAGACDVVIGTHRMLQKDIQFKDLGLVIIDEEQRFGVAHKEKLKQLRVMVDVLTMSATPIPRTLHMALTGARDMSLINTPPTNRAPIKTFVGEHKLPLIRTAILHELERGGQIYFVHNRVETIDQTAAEIRQLVPEARIAVGHGQMDEHLLENVMLDFASHQYDILVCTTIIESGLDIPNVNTIIINDADKLGLAQLYQLRGRVGRSDAQAYAYCLYRPQKALSETAENRLKAIREFTSLGSGYQIALRDMEIRGVGNILGSEQHGHMLAVGFDLYCKLLEESVSELKGEAKPIEADTQIDLNVTAFIPEAYISDNEQRLVEYKRLADVKTERHLEILLAEWKDRFGNLPYEVKQLASVVKLRLLASQAQVTTIKADMQGIRLSVDFRLKDWLPIQARLPKHLGSKTTYKPGIAGGHESTPYVLLKTAGIAKTDQLELLLELINAMVANTEIVR